MSSEYNENGPLATVGMLVIGLIVGTIHLSLLVGTCWLAWKGFKMVLGVFS